MGLDYSAAILDKPGIYTLYSSLEAHTEEKLMMRYGLKIGSRFLRMKDGVTNFLYIFSAIEHFLLVDCKQEMTFRVEVALKIKKTYRSASRI